MNTILLGSQSATRQLLLREAQIDFKVIGHHAQETACDWNQPFEELLLSIARAKMHCVVVPPGDDKQECFVLTADTMARDSAGCIHGKPEDRAAAIASIQSLRGYGTVGTAFCLERKQWLNGAWHTVQIFEDIVCAQYELDIPDSWIERYLHEVPYYMSIAGALTIEGFGAQFLKTVNGSYTTILGLPMVEVRQALEAMGFYPNKT